MSNQLWPATASNSASTNYLRVVDRLGGAVREYVDPDEARDLYALEGGRPGQEVLSDTLSYHPPVRPSKIIGIHVNYACRLAELGLKRPTHPTYFLKAPSALNGHLRNVVRPAGCQFLNVEGEVAVVIGKVARGVSVDDASDYVGGYTVANDFALHDLYSADKGALVRDKGADTLAPLGPLLVRNWSSTDRAIVTTVNDRIVQDGTTSSMMWSVPEIIADLSVTMTLYPGDVILTGTPARSRPIEVGDVVSVWIEGLGTLTNRIAEGSGLGLAGRVGAMPESERVLSRRISLGGDYV